MCLLCCRKISLLTAFVLEIQTFCYGICDSYSLGFSLGFHLNSNVSCEILAPHETPFFALYNTYEAACVVHHDNEFLEFVLSLHVACMMKFDSEFLELVSSLHVACMIEFDSEFLEFVLLLHAICTSSKKKKSEFLELVTSLNVVFMLCKRTGSELLDLEFVSSSYDICVISGFFYENSFYLVLSLHNVCMIPGECYIDTSEQFFSFYVICLTFEILAASYNNRACMTNQKNVLSLDVCLICKNYKRRMDICDVAFFEDAFIDLILFSHQECTTSDIFLRRAIAHDTVHYVTFSLRSLLKQNDACFVRDAGNCRFMKGAWGGNQQIYHFDLYDTFLVILKCSVLFFFIYRSFKKRIGSVIMWAKHYLGIEVQNIADVNDIKERFVVVEYIERRDRFQNLFCGGGRHQVAINGENVYKYLHNCSDTNLLKDRNYFEGKQFDFKRYELLSAISNNLETSSLLFYSKIPLDQLSNYLNMKELKEVSVLHKIPISSRSDKKEIMACFYDHRCAQCNLYVSVFTERTTRNKVISKEGKSQKEEEILVSSSKFPPDPPSKKLIESIITGFCHDTNPQNLIEEGCAVCGKLSPVNSMALLSEMKIDLNIISPGDVGRCERFYKCDPIIPINGPILAENCDYVCRMCQHFLDVDKIPPESLANSFWLGSVPLQLQNLTFAEKMLISRIRHNKCLVRVSSGRAKMTANVIMFSNPTVKVYHVLPPSRREVSEILAFVFQGPAQPTDTDIKRTPMLVRRNVVKDALEWLKLNHADYEDLHISVENLNDYPLAGVPVNIEYSKANYLESGNKVISAMSVYDDEFEEGTSDGPCPFTVHGLTGPEFENMSVENLKARALRHLAEKGSTLGISHDSKPQSMYDNPQAYPQMFPWLFPYGHGGIGQKCHFKKISEAKQKLNLLMYHDKRFQRDFYFPMVAFNHEQLKAGVTGSFLLAKKKQWPDISNRLKSLNQDVIKKISDTLSNGTHFSPTTVEEKKCFQLLNDLDHVGGFVKGSITSKKNMRNEIWSMISCLGAPSWFITLSPADNRHPICLYYADRNIEFRPNLISSNERHLLIAQNPVAAARFFDLMIRTFIKHVLGAGTEHSGLYGDTAGYYGTVEQQGRLTLHLHMILWIRNAISPQDIRDKLMNNDGEFKRSLIQYLEGCQKGEFLTGSLEYVKGKIPINLENKSKGIHTIFQNDLPPLIGSSYQDPTLILPEEPPKSCEIDEHKNCNASQLLLQWWSQFDNTVDDILLRSNVHKCSFSDSENKKKQAKGCLNKDGICKARFPRPIVPETTVNFEDGYINIKKLESMLNTISPCITYLFRCNTDVTSLLSGTSIKAVISYVSDYIVKPTLKTYQIFATAYNVFDRNAKLDADDSLRTDDARKLILKIVNALSSKMEIGSPMAAMYLLQHPDHYTSHQFIPFFWKTFVNHIIRSENSNEKANISHDVDIKMKDDFKKKEIIISPYPNLDYHEMKVEVEILVQQEGKFNTSVINNIGSNVPKLYDIDLSEMIEVETSLFNNMAIDTNDLNFVAGRGSHITRKMIPVYGEHFNDNTDGNYEFEDQSESGNEDENEAKKESKSKEEEEDPADEKLLILQDEGDYVASSKVDDYKFRPDEYKSSSVYDWLRLSVKIKVSRRKIDSTYFRFLNGHSQINSHMVKLVPSRSETYIINFIGGSLPRRDQGDYDYYCCTMLTLFKPWRSIEDLKDGTQSWVDAFTSCLFDIKIKKIMDNFHLRYECLDERDDYHAILKRQSKQKENKISSLFLDDHDNECDLGIQSMLEEDYGNQMVFGPNAIRKAQQMIEMEIMMNKAGWLHGEKVQVLNFSIHEFRPDIYKTGLEWKNVVKQCRQDLLHSKRKNLTPAKNGSQDIGKKTIEPSAVKILSAEYFMHNFQAKERKDHEIISNTIVDFSLNKEQKRAFHIIANHASEIYPDQLKMYLGGMGGTGKTQVIKALISMFDQRQENHRFVVLAPTGTAAALLNGSTYHSILGIHSSKYNGEEESIRNENIIIREVQDRLEGVDYIFIDEISMIACHELYNISSQLSKVTNEHNKPFGGKNIILAGDFAQLPPTNGSPLYSNVVSKSQKGSMTKREQEATIGKILWHQITTVVILTQNMRQTEMSEDDRKFRMALSNMRYAACTEDDIIFLETLRVNRKKKYSD